jgi:acyl-CoA dehydrogenase
MLPAMTPQTEELTARITAFMDEHIYPAEPVFQRQLESAADRWDELPGMAELKAKAKAAIAIVLCAYAFILTKQ